MLSVRLGEWGSAGAKQWAGKAAVTAQGRLDGAGPAVHLQQSLSGRRQWLGAGAATIRSCRVFSRSGILNSRSDMSEQNAQANPHRQSCTVRRCTEVLTAVTAPAPRCPALDQLQLSVHALHSKNS